MWEKSPHPHLDFFFFLLVWLILIIARLLKKCSEKREITIKEKEGGVKFGRGLKNNLANF
jgi:hypothetical protein